MVMLYIPPRLFASDMSTILAVSNLSGFVGYILSSKILGSFIGISPPLQDTNGFNWSKLLISLSFSDPITSDI